MKSIFKRLNFTLVQAFRDHNFNLNFNGIQIMR